MLRILKIYKSGAKRGHTDMMGLHRLDFFLSFLSSFSFLSQVVVYISGRCFPSNYLYLTNSLSCFCFICPFPMSVCLERRERQTDRQTDRGTDG